MTIQSVPGPAGLRRRAALEAAAAAPAPGAADAAFGGERGPALSAAEPLPIYSIPLEALAAPSPGLESARRHGWRVLTRDRDGWSLVDFAGAEPDGEAAAIRRSRPAELLLRAGTAAAGLADSGSTYEPRILEVGRLGFSALWLHSDEAADRFFTLEEEPREQDAASLFAMLGPRARLRLASAAAAAGDGSDDSADELSG